MTPPRACPSLHPRLRSLHRAPWKGSLGGPCQGTDTVTSLFPYLSQLKRRPVSQQEAECIGTGPDWGNCSQG